MGGEMMAPPDDLHVPRPAAPWEFPNALVERRLEEAIGAGRGGPPSLPNHHHHCRRHLPRRAILP